MAICTTCFSAESVSATTYETGGGIERFPEGGPTPAGRVFQVWGLGKDQRHTCPGKGVLESRISSTNQRGIPARGRRGIQRVVAVGRSSRFRRGNGRDPQLAFFVAVTTGGSAQSKRSRISEAEPGPGGVDARDPT